jgi:hypothetical protein
MDREVDSDRSSSVSFHISTQEFELKINRHYTPTQAAKQAAKSVRQIKVQSELKNHLSRFPNLLQMIWKKTIWLEE